MLELQGEQSSTRPGLSVAEHMGMLQEACRCLPRLALLRWKPRVSEEACLWAGCGRDRWQMMVYVAVGEHARGKAWPLSLCPLP